MAWGIYQIENLSNGKRYIGQSCRLIDRWSYHRYELRKDIHPNQKLQRAWNKYGEDYFSFTVLQIVEDILQLTKVEQYWMDLLKPEYNIRVAADSNKGCTYKRSEKTRQKLSLLRKGKPKTAKQVEAMSLSRKGKTKSLETRQKISLAAIGNKNSKGCTSSEHARKIAIALKAYWNKKRSTNV